MAQRDYEDQPEAPDLGAAVQLESAATLEASAGDRDGLDAGYVPPDRPYGLDEDGVTGAGMREGDSLDERLRRERPEVGPTDPDRSGRITIADEGAALETPDAMDGVDVGIDGGAASAEEAAVHEIDSPGAPWEFEPSVAASPALGDPELDAALADEPDAARVEAARDARADTGFTSGTGLDPAGIDPSGIDPAGSDRGRADAGQVPGGDRDGRAPDPALPRDPADSDPAARIDASREAGGAAAPASGRDDVGPGSGL